MIRGIAPVYARKLVKAFGAKVFDVIASVMRRADAGHLAQTIGFGLRMPQTVGRHLFGVQTSFLHRLGEKKDLLQWCRSQNSGIVESRSSG